MKVELLVSEWCPTCPAAEQVWRQVASEKAFEFAVVDVAQREGRELISRLRLRSVPSVVVDGELKGVGVQTLDAARALVAAAPVRARRRRAYHAGMMLSRDNRLWIVCSMLYLLAAGAFVLGAGSLLPAGSARAAAPHVYGAGCLLFLVYGLESHMLPRFTGNPIVMGSWPWLQFVFAQLGLPLLCLGLWWQHTLLAAVGGLMLWLSFVLHAMRIWPVLWPKGDAQRGNTISDPFGGAA